MPLDRRKSASAGGDADQGDTCRICRGEGTIDQPLFYPCKCSGSIKFVHQDCLMEWLSHSQKKYCELCKTPYRFTKLYDQSMPENLPFPLFVRQAGLHTFRTGARWLRYVFVTFIWTCWLPWSIRQIWRGLFWLADGSWMTAQEIRQISPAGGNSSLVNVTTNDYTTASMSSDGLAHGHTASYFDPVAEMFNLLTGAPLLRGLLRLFSPKPNPNQHSIAGTNSTDSAFSPLAAFARQPSLLSNVSSLNSLTNYPLVNNGLIDILEGQLICLSVIAAFILVFLIREWVINQQPILNMPNPDRVEAQPAPAPINEDGRQQGQRRRLVARRPLEHDRPIANANVQPNQRPLAPPRAHTNSTDENFNTTARPTTYPLERPNMPTRSSSLTPATSMAGTGMFHMDLDRDESPWYRQGPSTMRSIGSPPLQRGMLDDVVDIRRNIEERITSLSEGSSDHSELLGGLYENNTDRLTPSTSGSEDKEDDQDEDDDGTDLYPGPDTFHRDHFVFGQNRQEAGMNPAANPELPFPSSFVARDANTTDSTNSIVQPDDHSLSDEHGQSREQAVTQENHDESMPQNLTTNVDAHEPDNAQDSLDTANQEPTSNQDAEVQHADDDTDPETFLGRVVQWMWHTDARIRVPVQDIEQIEANALGGIHNRGRLLPIGNANPNPNGNDNAVNVVQDPANPPAHQPNIQLGIDLNDVNAVDDAEDLEGVLELIGMEGPLAGMIQNIIFSVFLITLTLSASVWCPYIWGKIAILIMSNPVGVFLKAPLFVVSKCGNILVDLLLFVGGLIAFGLSNLTKLIKVVVAPALPSIAAQIRVGAIESWSYGVSQNSGVRLEKALSGTLFGLRPDLPSFSMQSHHALRVFRKAFVEASSAVSSDVLDTVQNALDSWHKHGILGAPVFVYNEIVSFPKGALNATNKMAHWFVALNENLRMRPLSEMLESELSHVEWTTEDKILAIVVGYAFFAAAGFAYLKIAHLFFGMRKDEKIDGIFADSLRQAGGVLKVIVIIGIEMIAFPLYCGLLLGGALLPLFQDATFQSRLAFFIDAPVTCVFIHWFVGTCYMFHFALFVSMCRKIMRKGVLYFIRDPDDPTFHPVRDVLERPVATQLGKIAFSALVYGGLVIVCLGGVVWTIGSLSTILPLHWTTTEPRLAFPVDIVFYNFMLPFILRRAEPSKKISAMYEWWFRQCARKLRLSHFLFKEEHEDEKRETTPFWQSAQNQSPGISTIVSEGLSHDDDAATALDGRYVRAPAADSVRIPKGTRVFVEVDVNNNRIDGQPDNDKGMHGKNDDRFIKIYVPSHFRARISTFIFLVWAFAASTGVAFTVVPLVIGRSLIGLAAASTAPPNDLYAFTVGMHVCGGIALIIYAGLTRKVELQSTATNFATNTRESLPRLYNAVKYILGLIYLFTSVFVILPFATSLLTELYVHMPIYSYFANAASAAQQTLSLNATTSIAPLNPTIFILQTWTLGLLYLRLALRIAISYPNGQNRPSTALRAITRNGYLHPDVQLATRALIFPALTLCIVLLAAPLGLAKIIILVTGTTSAQEKVQIYRYSYPFLMGMAVSVYTAIGLQHKIESWRVKIRDEVYLVGERLHNFTEPDGKKKRPAGADTDKGKGKVPVRIVQNDRPSAIQEEQGQQQPQVVGHEFGGSEGAVASGSSRM